MLHAFTPARSRALLSADVHRHMAQLVNMMPTLDEHDLEVLAARLNDARLELSQALDDYRLPPAQVIGFKDLA